MAGLQNFAGVKVCCECGVATYKPINWVTNDQGWDFCSRECREQNVHTMSLIPDDYDLFGDWDKDG